MWYGAPEVNGHEYEDIFNRPSTSTSLAIPNVEEEDDEEEGDGKMAVVLPGEVLSCVRPNTTCSATSHIIDEEEDEEEDPGMGSSSSPQSSSGSSSFMFICSNSTGSCIHKNIKEAHNSRDE